MATYERRRNTFVIEDVKIWAGQWRNFSGKGGEWNAEGARNFWIEIPEDLAEFMEKDHWNVKHRPDRDDPELMHHIIKININYNSDYPPKIFVLNKRKKTRNLMDESVIYRLDRAYITYADIEFNSYKKERPGGRTTNTGWLQELTIEIEENYLQEKYADYEEVSMDPLYEDEEEQF